MTNPRTGLALLLICCTALTAADAQTQQPPPPEEIFRYVAFDAGDAIEVDWAVEDGAYM